jgi:hypothetical protein
LLHLGVLISKSAKLTSKINDDFPLTSYVFEFPPSVLMVIPIVLVLFNDAKKHERQAWSSTTASTS